MSHHRSHWTALGLLFVGSLAVYHWLFDYVVILQYAGPDSFFLFSRRFLEQWLDFPGGLLVYAGRFVRQFYHFRWLGTAINAATISVFGALWYLSLRRLAQAPGILLTLLPGVLLMALQGDGSDRAHGLVLACLAFLGYLHLRAGWPRRLGALVATPLLYAVLGGYFWIFVVWVLLTDLLDWRTAPGVAFRLLYPAYSVGIPLLAYRWVYPVSWDVAWQHPAGIPSSPVEAALAGCLIVFPAAHRLLAGTRAQALLHTRAGRNTQIAFTGALAALALAACYDAGTNRFSRYHRLVEQRRWDAVLELYKTDPSPSSMAQLFANHALYNRGELLDRMFEYPQHWGTEGLIHAIDMDPESLRLAMYNSDLYYAMGQISKAYRLALNQTNLGYSYANLERIAACHVITGNHRLAAKYVRQLGQTLFHRETARRLAGLLTDDATLADLEAAGLPRQRDTVPLGGSRREFATLIGLVEGDPGNHMAFTYLTAWHLLDKTSVPLIAANMEGFRSAGYRRIPVHCQEALAMYAGRTGQQLDELIPGYDPSIQSRVAAFVRAAQQHRDPEHARRALQEPFGSTFMYYLWLTRTPQNPANPADWLLLGKVYHAKQQYDPALRFFRQALRQTPSLAEAHMWMGSALAARGDTAAARAAYERAIALGISPDERPLDFSRQQRTQ